MNIVSTLKINSGPKLMTSGGFKGGKGVQMHPPLAMCSKRSYTKSDLQEEMPAVLILPPHNPSKKCQGKRKGRE